MVTYLCSFCGYTLYCPAINELHQHDCQCCHQHLGYNKCEPDGIDCTDLRQNDSRGQHDNELYNRGQERFSAVAECLEESAEYQRQPRKREYKAHDTQSDSADLQYLSLCIEQCKQSIGDKLKDQKSAKGDRHRCDQADADRFQDTFTLACTEVIGNDRNDGIFESPYWYQNNALQADIDDIHRRCSFGKA